MNDWRWDWQRLWIPASAHRDLTRVTLLPDAIAETDTAYKTLAQLANSRLLILLGEPGIGKSTEMSQFKDQQLELAGPDQVLWLDGRTIGSEYRLDREWFDSTKYLQWLAGDHNLWIFFDGYDQSNALINGLDALIESRLASAPIDRLYLRISSRTAEWNYSLGQKLESLFSEASRVQDKTCSAFVIAAPRVADVANAVSSEGLDFADFMRQLDQVQIGPIALRPIGLKWLINLFRANGRFPETAEELYWQGMRILSQDVSDQGPIRARDILSAEEIRLVAARIAFVTVFSNRDSIWTGLDAGNISGNSVAIAELTGAVESQHRIETEVTEPVVRQSLRRAIFSGLDADTVGWAHQTFREFLAARYCVERNLPIEQILGLLTNPSDSQGKIVPNLREVASWLASMRPDVLEQLIDRDPQTLFDSDVALAGPEQRKRLLHALVQGVDSGSVIFTRGHARDEFRKLFFPGIEEPLRALLADRNLNERARMLVVDTIRDCRVHALAEQLAEIALDRTEPELFRVSAAWGIRELEDENARKMIKPLIHAVDTETFLSPQSIDDLRGCALSSVWRNHISIQELLQVLSKPVWHGSGGYRLFLSGDFTEKLLADEFPLVFEWLDSQTDWGERHWELETVEQRLLEMAWSHLDNEEVLECFASYVVRHLSGSSSIFGKHVAPRVTAAYVSDEVRRRLALGTIIPMLGGPSGREFADIDLLRYTGLVQPTDLPWYLEQIRYSASNATTQELWVRVAFQGYDPGNVEHTQLIWALKEDGLGGLLLAGAFDAVPLDSQEADHQRLIWKVFYSGNDPDATEIRQGFPAKSEIVKLLNQIQEGKTDAWWRLDYWLQVDDSGLHRGGAEEWETDIRTFPGWDSSNPEIQEFIVSGANAYLRSNRPDSEWYGTLDCQRPDLAGFRAFVLLHVEAPELFQDLPSTVWREWGSVFLAFPPKTNSDEIPYQTLLLTQAVAHGFEVIDTLRLIAKQKSDTSSYIFSSALRAACAVSDESQRTVLAEEFINVKWRTTVVEETVRVLVEIHNHLGAAQLSVDVAKVFAANKETHAIGAQIAGHILLNRAAEHWDDLWPVIVKSKELRFGVFHFISWRDRRNSELSVMLNEHQLGDLFKTLARDFPPKDDPDHQGYGEIGFRVSVSWWRDSVLNHLAQRGTWAAVDELTKIAGELSEVDWIVIRVAQARELARSKTWSPPTPADLMHIVLSPEKRIVENASQLQEVVLESLRRLQRDIQAETPDAAYYWNHPNRNNATPKDEKEISNYIKRHLDRDLLHSGIVINREVENRRGNITDIYVQATQKNGRLKGDTITIVGEVKGCWNEDLYADQEDQLLNRYLIENGHSHGIYIVAFFDGNRWKSTDSSSRHNAKKHTLEDLRIELAIQSNNLSENGKELRTVVLDMNF